MNSSNPWQEGDPVTVGKGKTIWVVTGDFTSGAGQLFVTLTKEGSNGYVNSSWNPEALVAAQ